MKADKDDVKAIIKMPDILQAFGVRYDRNRIPCPLHGGKDNNFSWKESSWTCYSQCGSGDIFTFTMLMNGCDFPTALDFICSRFGIQNDGKSDPAFEKMLQERQKAAQERDAERVRQRYVYGRLCAYKRHLEALESAVMIENHIALCNRLLDRMCAGEKLFVDDSIDDRLTGLWQQIKR